MERAGMRRTTGRERGSLAALAQGLALVSALLAGLAGAEGSAADDRLERARFTVTDDVLLADMEPFGVSSAHYGNALAFKGSGFEPTIIVSRYIARRDSPDRVYAPPDQMTLWNSIRTGAFDGAEVAVYRVESGKLRVVRHERVAEGGYEASGWRPTTPRGKPLAPDVNRYRVEWRRWSRPAAVTWFTVRAVGPDGAMSPPAEAVAVRSPADMRADGGKSGVPLRTVRLASRSGGPGDLPAPADLRLVKGPEGQDLLEWSPVEGAAGYRVFESEEPPSAHRGFYMALEKGADGEPVRRGDLVFLRAKFHRHVYDEVLSNRVWNAGVARRLFRRPIIRSSSEGEDDHRWSLEPHPSDTPVEHAGETFLRVWTEPGSQVRLFLRLPDGTGRGTRPVFRPGDRYVVSLWLRGDRPGVVKPRIDPIRTDEGQVELPSPDLAFGTEWREARFEFEVPALDTSNKRRRMFLTLEADRRIDIDALRIYRSDAPYFALTPEEERRLRGFAGGAFRAYHLAAGRRNGYDLERMTSLAGAGLMKSLPNVLSTVQQAGMEPWISIEPHMMPDEWAGLVEYLAAPFDPALHDPAARPWAAKRHAQGRAEPWTEAFERIRFELGNETWNQIFYPAVLPEMTDAATGREYERPHVYGLFIEHALERMRESPWWEPSGLEDKLEVVIGGWAGWPYGAKAASVSPRSDVLAISAYNGGWDVGEGPVTETPQGFSTVLNDVNQLARPIAERHAEEAAALSGSRERPLATGAYEAGPGYALNGLNKARVTPQQVQVQERVMKSVAAGAATLDAFLTRAAAGFTVQTFFQYAEGKFWSSHARWYMGGHAFPSWDWLALVNNEGLGDVLDCRTEEVPRMDLAAFKRRIAVEDAPLVGCHAMRRDDRLMLVLVSRRVPGYPEKGDDGRTRVEVALPFESARSVRRFTATGDYRTHNYEGPETRIVEDVVAENWTGPVLTVDALPPGEPVAYVFEGIGR